jgi:predicted amidohydrolase YtcJ
VTDLILHGGTVLTMDDTRPRATAIALQAGRVQAVGDDELLDLRTACTEVVELHGRTACPGFIDAHLHLTLAAWYQRGVDLGGCRSREEALQRLTGGTPHPHSPAGGDDAPWIYAYNYRPALFTSGGGINRYDLDHVSGGGPVLVMHFSFHECVVSSAGLLAAGITRLTPDPIGGRIVRDRHGEASGELLETAVGPVEALARTAAMGTGYADWLAALQRYCAGLFAAGITHVCDPGVDAMLESYLRRAMREGTLPIPVSMLFMSGSGFFVPPYDRLAGPVTGDTLDGLQVGALKLFADGGSRCAVCVGLRESFSGIVAQVGRAARLRKPALLMDAKAPERPHLHRDGSVTLGYLHYESGRLTEITHDAAAKGFQLAVHAACNAGIEAALTAYERLPAGATRHRLEHLVSLDRSQARRIASLGAIGVVQPSYIESIGDEWDAMPSPARLHSVPLRDLLDAGVTLAGSSDAPIASYAPLAGMVAAVTRRTARGAIHEGEQSIGHLEALRLWTTGSALAVNLEHEIGVLKPGARGDLVVLSENPLTVPAERLGHIRVERTILAGRTVFSHPVDPRLTNTVATTR